MQEMVPAWVDGRLMPVEKLEAHQRGLRHKAISVFVMAGESVLIQRRAAGKYHTPGLWANTCCTHPRWGEEAADCAVRRLREELGITGLVTVFADQVEYRADVGSGLIEHEVVDIFVAEAPQDLPVAPDPEEVWETRWVDLHDLAREVEEHPERFTPWLRIYLADHMERIFGKLRVVQ
ncbi:isopentenyl-diphosphate Delta-isomerase [Cereibacter sediminicola]|uniref:isopentenyl-diphosphate Delta-isomerase n=1 Tax=Cereibacter sediminicola TaxID=2584941 RepID=UPI0011A98A26|nr:isopentenyl-diphosphate Delta-isomerase [Cereibacter sediminicola]